MLTLLLLTAAGAVAYLQQRAELQVAISQRDQALAEQQRVERALAETRAELMERDLSLDERKASLEDAQSRLAKLQHDNVRLREEQAAATRSQQNLEAEMRRAIESKDITISELQGKLTVDILERVLFDSGEAKLKPEGEQILRRVAVVLAQYPTRQVHVIGHTDNIPIRAASWSRYPSNWELSTARATAAVRFLSEEAGVDPRRLGAVGYGEFRPVAENESPEGRAKNRRIALVVLSEELVGSDSAPTARELGATAAPALPPPAGEGTPVPPAAEPAVSPRPVPDEAAPPVPATNAVPADPDTAGAL